MKQDQSTRIAELEALIVELEAENNALAQESVNLLKSIATMKPTREQIAELVKPLEWNKSFGIWVACGANFDYSYGDDKPRLFIRDLLDNRTPSTLYSDFAELRAAAEQHHRETVLSLLNLPA